MSTSPAHRSAPACVCGTSSWWRSTRSCSAHRIPRAPTSTCTSSSSSSSLSARRSAGWPADACPQCPLDPGAPPVGVLGVGATFATTLLATRWRRGCGHTATVCGSSGTLTPCRLAAPPCPHCRGGMAEKVVAGRRGRRCWCWAARRCAQGGAPRHGPARLWGGRPLPASAWTYAVLTLATRGPARTFKRTRCTQTFARGGRGRAVTQRAPRLRAPARPSPPRLSEKRPNLPGPAGAAWPRLCPAGSP